MKSNQVMVGMLVVVSDEPDTQLYTVKAFDGTTFVDLVYFAPIDNRECWGGRVHVSWVQPASKIQLNYATIKKVVE